MWRYVIRKVRRSTTSWPLVSSQRPLLLIHFGLPDLSWESSDPPTIEFDDWWPKTINMVTSSMETGLKSLITLGAWIIWKHRNDCVLMGSCHHAWWVMQLTRDEVQLWVMIWPLLGDYKCLSFWFLFVACMELDMSVSWRCRWLACVVL